MSSSDAVSALADDIHKQSLTHNKSQSMQNANLTRIHGKWYDLKNFDSHPGGASALRLSEGRDGTVLFESHHPFTSREMLAKMMAKYEVAAPADGLTLEESHAQQMGIVYDNELFEWPAEKSQFAKEMFERVKLHFVEQAKIRKISVSQAIKATPVRKAFNAGLFSVFLFSIYLMTQENYFGLLLFPLFGWLSVAHTFHDLSHFSFSSNPLVNKVLPYLFPFFTSPTSWSLQHIVGHHCYPNIPHRDPDISHTPELRRDHPAHPWSPAHETQHTFPVLAFNWGGAILLGLNISNEFTMVFGDPTSYNKCIPMIKMSRFRVFLHLFARFASILAVTTWPFLILKANLFVKLVFAVGPIYLLSYLFMINTQINHLSPNTITPPPTKDWYAHQVITSQDFGKNSLFHWITSGGLNLQIEHHLFPTINHCHLREIQPIVQDCCIKHNIPYNMVSGYFEGLVYYWQHTSALAKPPKPHAE